MNPPGERPDWKVSPGPEGGKFGLSTMGRLKVPSSGLLFLDGRDSDLTEERPSFPLAPPTHNLANPPFGTIYDFMGEQSHETLFTEPVVIVRKVTMRLGGAPALTPQPLDSIDEEHGRNGLFCLTDRLNESQKRCATRSNHPRMGYDDGTHRVP
ncbi:hypothetical protein BDV37DRAFT_21222 [Aspergillus pseudonomiae]|uniref:Uncharacterized protein n=1 Tax=Aspergillus pseudonomiae TaxID=1506151 RepID=A0A5N7CXW7_9EURO|nr:uncharacterized protein BDV37DRAFT_21222 [Aspergillus pseudonomiae]KAE8398789.1 hypothetical protein BDV37DRAFT_21222 [Aspergillus pseudonomiae]